MTIQSDNYLDGSSVLIPFRAVKGSEQAARDALITYLKRVGTDGIRQDIILGGLSRSITRHFIAQLDGAEHLPRIALDVFAGENVDQEQEFVSRLKEITGDDLKAFVDEYLAQPGGTK